MEHTIVRDKQSAAGAALRIALTVAAAVLLPQLFHAVGAISGTGTALGAALLPMHIPVLLAGLLYGPVVGVAAGVLSPLLSAAVSDMPTAALLPFMVLELGVYGLTSGFLSRTGLHGFTKLLLAQLAGRAARALAVLTAIYLLRNTRLEPAAAWQFVTAGLFGILIQWAVIPLLVKYIQDRRNQHA
ncbi:MULTISPECIES: ECF transporter S component [Ruminococcus]|uniref:ECF transporter S component n=2 Tax=Oscillospiraceae TaxID=216572 RepID=UPI000340C93A|nr:MULTISPECIES: ECF transporter S component [Ruminococcus]CDD54270.1 putative uncharacterized protein [Ruminococcus sp. CAG:379]